VSCTHLKCCYFPVSLHFFHNLSATQHQLNAQRLPTAQNEFLRSQSIGEIWANASSCQYYLTAHIFRVSPIYILVLSIATSWSLVQRSPNPRLMGFRTPLQKRHRKTLTDVIELKKDGPILYLLSILDLCLPSDWFSWDFLTKILYALLISPHVVHVIRVDDKTCWQLGIAIGFLLPPLLVKNSDSLHEIGHDLSVMYYCVAGFTTALLVLIVLCEYGQT
jgi:hypothetical protein